MKKRSLILAGIGVVMVLAASVPNALAYFTTYASAKGMKTVVLGERTEIKEPGFDNWTKHITIKAENPSEPVFIRAQAYAPDGIILVYKGTNWSTAPDEEGWYYYAEPIANGAAASQLDVQIRVRDETGKLVNPELKEGETLNVAVVYEYTPVLFKKAGESFTPAEVAEGCEFKGDANESGMRMAACWKKSVTLSGTASSETVPSDGGSGTGTGGD